MGRHGPVAFDVSVTHETRVAGCPLFRMQEAYQGKQRKYRKFCAEQFPVDPLIFSSFGSIFSLTQNLLKRRFSASLSWRSFLRDFRIDLGVVLAKSASHLFSLYVAKIPSGERNVVKPSQSLESPLVSLFPLSDQVV